MQQSFHPDHLVVVALHEYLNLPRLERLPEAAARVTELFTGLGFARALERLANDGRWRSLTAGLDDWQLRGRRLVLYWGGHGVHSDDVYYLLATDSPARPSNTNAIQAATLGQALARSHVDEILLIVDACGSGGGASQVARAFELGVAGVERADGCAPGLAVIASARRFRHARELALSEAIVKVLRDGPPAGPERGMWGPRDRLISPNALAAAVAHELGGHGLSADFSSCGIYGNFIPNPRYRPDLPDVELESRRRRDVLVSQDVQEHFLLKFRGVEQPSDSGWFFAGRHDALRELSSWLATARSGMYVVTGAPGTGKSAILGCVAVLSVQQYRAIVARSGLLESIPNDAVPATGSIDVGVHAKNKTLLDCVSELADALGLRAPAGLWGSGGELVAAVEGLVRQRVRALASERGESVEAFLQNEDALRLAVAQGHRITVLVDALDEAVDKDIAAIATDLLRPLAATPLVRVLVGTRPNRGPLGTKGSPLLRALAPDRCVVLGSGTLVEYGDFDNFAAPDTLVEIVPAASSAMDVADYARHRLTDARSVYRDVPDEAELIADLVAAHSDGVFLAARLLTRALADLPEAYPHDAPEVSAITRRSVQQMFAAELTRFAEEESRATELLLPLAWAEGAGLPREPIWLALVNALSSRPEPYRAADLDWLMDKAGAHLVESGEEGQTVYRLYHQSYGDFLRGLRDQRQTQRAITSALTATVHSGGRYVWRRANAYLLRHLSAHAAAGGQLTDLMRDAAYVIAADPDRLTKVLGEVDYQQHAIVRTYWRAVELLRSAPSATDRAAILHAVATRDEPEAVSAFAAVAEGQHCLFTTAPSRSTFRRLLGHRGAVLCVAFGRVEDRLVLATAGYDTAVRLWDARSGDQLTTINGHSGAVHHVAFGEIQGRPVLVSAAQDQTTKIWDATSHALIRTVNGDASAIESVDGDIVTATISSHDGSVTVRRLSDDQTLSLFRPRGIAVDVALGVFGSSLGVAVATFQGTLDVWTDTGLPVVSVPSRWRGSAAFTTTDDRLLLAIDSADGLRLWNLAAAVDEIPVDRAVGATDTFVLGTVHGSAVLVTTSGGNLRRWDLDHRWQTGVLRPLSGEPMTMAIGDLYGHALVAVGYRAGHVELVPLDTTGRTGPADEAQVTCAAFGSLHRRPVVAYGDLHGNAMVKRVDDRSKVIARSAGAARLLAIASVVHKRRHIVAVCTATGTLRMWSRNQPSRDPGFSLNLDLDAAAIGRVDDRLVAAVRTAGARGTKSTMPLRHSNAEPPTAVDPVVLHVVDLFTGRVLSTLEAPVVEQTNALAVGELDGVPVLILAVGSRVEVLALDDWRSLGSLAGRGRRITTVSLSADGLAGLLAVDDAGMVFRWSPGQLALTPIHETALLRSRLVAMSLFDDRLLLATADEAGISVHATRLRPAYSE